MKQAFPRKRVYIISACLVGLGSRYDGTHALEPLAVKLLKAGRVLPLCPEQLGGLPTPREPAEIERADGKKVKKGLSRVINQKGGEVTSFFLQGAKEVGLLASQINVRGAILKDGSPSCGVTYIYRRGRRVKGLGVTAAWLQEQGIPLYTIKEGELKCIRPKQ